MLPGDVIATGHSRRRGIGFTPPKYLQAEDVIQVSIFGAGLLENRIAFELLFSDPTRTEDINNRPEIKI